MKIHHATPQHACAEDTTAAVLALAGADPRLVDSAIASDPDLFAAIVHHSRFDDLWLPQLIGQLQQQGVTRRDCDRLEGRVKERVRAARSSARTKRATLRTIDPDAAPPLVRAALGDDAPVHEEAVVPAGFRLSRGGIVMAKAPPGRDVQEVPICPDPVVISGRLVETSRATNSSGWRGYAMVAGRQRRSSGP